VSRQGPGVARLPKEGHEGPGVAIHMKYIRRRGEDDHARIGG
jgi:hypothetical protein